jgi:hypothetical protein
VVISYGRFGTIHRPQRQGSRIKMGPIGCPETSERNYHYSLRNNPEEHSPHPFRGGSLTSRTFTINDFHFLVVVARTSLYCGGAVTWFVVLRVKTCRRVEGEMHGVSGTVVGSRITAFRVHIHALFKFVDGAQFSSDCV